MEEKQTITQVDFNSLGQNTQAIYADEEIIILNNLSQIQRENRNTYLLNMVFVVFCERGKMQCRLNGTPCTLETGNMVVLVPKTLVEDPMISTDFEFHAMALSYDAVKYTMRTYHSAWDLGLYFLRHPIVPVSERANRISRLYYELAYEKISNPNKLFYKEIMHSIFQCVFFEILSVVHPLMSNAPADGTVRQGEILCKRFLDLVSQGDGRERSVKQLAAQLCVTPKYLSTVVKNVSGRTALEWMHQICIDQIKMQLRYTNKSVKEIADGLRFDNLSFFGKFVKNHIGMSPTDYRRHLYEEDKSTQRKDVLTAHAQAGTAMPDV